MLSDEKFCESAMKFALVENTEGKFFKLDDYKKLIEGAQTDKDGNLIYLYATDKDAQYTYVKAAADKGYDVLLMNGQLDIPFVGMLEQKNEKTRFVRVDSDVIDNLIKKEDSKQTDLSEFDRNIASTLFKSQIPSVDKAEFYVTYAALSPDAQPIVITQSEYMRRMKDMSAFQPGMNFYGEMPDAYNLTLNTNHPLVKKVIGDAVAAVSGEVKPLDEELTAVNNVIKAIKDLNKDNKGIPDDKKSELSDNEKKAEDLRAKQKAVVTKYASGQEKVKQLIDISLLSIGLLKGEALSNFLKRSVDLL
jgi:molecular chaperone HtpG